MKFSTLIQTDISNKVVVITGANAGLGFEAARYFAARGAEVIGAVRSIQRGADAQAHILRLHPQANIRFMECDLSRKSSIEQCAHQIIATTPAVDILLNNAGVMSIPYEQNEDGIEMQFAINHLGHFRLTALLYSHFKVNARIVNVSSLAHRQCTFDLNDPYYLTKPYHAFRAYAQSKLANLLFTRAFNEKCHTDARNLIAVSAHPGIAMTSLFNKVEPHSMFRKLYPLLRLLIPNAQQGAKPLIMACLDTNAKPNHFYGPSLMRNSDSVKLSSMSFEATQATLAQQLWTFSNQATQLSFLE